MNIVRNYKLLNFLFLFCIFSCQSNDQTKSEKFMPLRLKSAIKLAENIIQGKGTIQKLPQELRDYTLLLVKNQNVYQLGKAAIEAARSGNYHFIQDYLKAGFGPDPFDINGITPLLAAAENNKTQIPELLLENGADVTYSTNFHGYQAIHIAAINNHADLVKLLLIYKADIEALDKNSATPLIEAASYINAFDAIKILVDHQAKINAQDVNGYTALINAIITSDTIKTTKIIEYLINHGANVNLPDNYGQTPLMYASQRPNLVPIIKLLIAKGARLNDVDSYRQTALMAAALQGSLETVKLLVEAGADLSLIDTMGESALDFARRSENNEIIEYLESKLYFI